MQREGENFTVIERADAEHSEDTTSLQQDHRADIPSTSDYTASASNVPSTSQNIDQSTNSSGDHVTSSEENQSSPSDTQSQSSSSDNVIESSVIDSSDLSTEIRRRRLEFYTKSAEPSAGRGENVTSSQTVHTEAPPSGQHDQQSSTSEGGSGQESSSGAPSGENVTLNEGATLGASADGNIRVKIKYLDDRQRQVEAKPGETIGEFKR